MSSAVCKICGREYREGRQCPERGGEVVCIACCKSAVTTATETTAIRANGTGITKRLTMTLKSKSWTCR